MKIQEKTINHKPVKITIYKQIVKTFMKTLKTLFFALSLNSTLLTISQATEPTAITASPQVAGYYHHQIGNTQITALLDGTNYLNPAMFKGLTDSEKTEILKKYHADQAKGVQTSVNALHLNHHLCTCVKLCGSNRTGQPLDYRHCMRCDLHQLSTAASDPKHKKNPIITMGHDQNCCL